MHLIFCIYFTIVWLLFVCSWKEKHDFIQDNRKGVDVVDRLRLLLVTKQ